MGPKRDVIGELADGRRAAEGLVFGALVAPRRALVVLRRRQDASTPTCEDPAYADFYGPAVSRKTSEAQQTPARRGVPRRLAGALRASWWTSTSRSWSGSTGGSSSRPFTPYLQKFAAYYYNRGAEWGQRRGDQLQEARRESFPDTAGVLDVERGQLAGMRPLFWQTDTSVVEELLGLRREPRVQDVGRDRSTTWWTSSARTARCCSTSARRPDGTIPEPEQRMLREIGAVAGGERRGDLRHAAVDDRSARARRRSSRARSPTRSAPPFTGQDIRFTTQGRHAVRDRAGVAGVRHRVDQGVGGERAGGDPRDCGGRGPRRSRRRQVDAGRRGPSPSGGRAADPGAGGGGVSH